MVEDKFDYYKRTALHYVCIDIPKANRATTANELLKSGEDINAQDKGGWTPLHFAAQEGDLEVAEILVNAGANITLKDLNGNTPLWVATMNSYHSAQVINLLLESGADPTQPNDHGVSPVEIAPEHFDNAT